MQFLGKCYKAKQLEREIKRFTKKKCVWKLRERDRERERKREREREGGERERERDWEKENGNLE